MTNGILMTKVKAMRKAQDRYRRTHSWKDQDECRVLEKEVDSLIADIEKKDRIKADMEQMRLF